MKSYFELRNITPEEYGDYVIPQWLLQYVERAGRSARILDFGCGFGQLLSALKERGFERAEGVDVDAKALSHCRDRGYTVHDLGDGEEFVSRNLGQFDLIVTQHVLEHIPKADVVARLVALRTLLSPAGRLLVAVPNAQAFTGAYWAFEDFTHHTLYTSGSLFYVLAAAGFSDIEFVDVRCTAGLAGMKRLIRNVSWLLYDRLYRMGCRLLSSPTHIASPNVYSYEIKAVARVVADSPR